MALKAGGLDVNKLFITLLIIFVALQAGSYIYSEFVDSTPLKLGWTFLLVLVVVAIISLYTLGKRIGSLNTKDIIFIIIEAGAIIGLFYYLPDLIPQIFSSISP